MVTSVKTKSMSKLVEATIDAEDCHKELDQKKSLKGFKLLHLLYPKERRKKKPSIFRLQKLLRRRRILKMKLAEKMNVKGGKMPSSHLTKILKTSSEPCWNRGS